MSKVTQYSRISHHTLAGSASATFSVPASEDFTDGSWSIYDLALSEIGINEDSKKAYIRINDEVKEFEFIGGTAGGESLSDTLVVGNTTGANDIIVDNDRLIKTTDTGFIQFGDTGADLNAIIINNGGDGVTIPANSFGFSGVDPYWTSQVVDISGITDTISLDPQGLGNGTGILSEDTTNNQSSQLNITPTDQSLNLYDTTFTNYNVGLENAYLSFSNAINSKIVAQNIAGISSAKVEVSVDLTVDKSQIDILADTTNMSLPAYADDATAGTASLTTGTLYQTDGTAPSPLNVAGIVMIKQ